MDDPVSERAEYDTLEEAADAQLARKAARTLHEEGDAPRASLAEVLADILGSPAPGAT
ncbi:hypothetical protein ACFY0F_31895 [Streptomyces sp. NPDC001544]|uniref:hypothetical protein n=1 Tax=Streptomyces sp. NPDC001544 TaxID=3364584 RepID=UPI00369D16C4